ncbi:ABC transporter substrate-binding protein [Halomontanus rarus]|uniref:ABC transporter substrate-binding protein n=1 Tax=Halomontanus rarus TaxID=3034020 RepID=UPI00293BDB7D|nr:ABC transporter substrate-binding protein [Halovivax sp. KZCA124]
MTDAPRRVRRDVTAISRRKLCGSIATAGLGAVAGCIDPDAYDPSDPTRRLDGPAWHTIVSGFLPEVNVGQPDGLLERFAFDVGFRRHPETGEPTYVLASSFEETDSSVSITLRDGLEWSNGEPLTGSDLGRWAFMRRMGSSLFHPPSAIRSGNRRPRSGFEAITDVEWDERTVTVAGDFETVRSPLFELNTFVGRYPRSYYERLWDAFEESFQERTTDEQPRESRSELIDDHIRRIGDEFLPSEGVLLEDEYDGDGIEAAYSGLWYPTRREDGVLYFSRNDAHPFAERTDVETVAWTFHEGPNRLRNALRSGVVDGAMITDVNDELLEELPDEYERFEARGDRLAGVTVNHDVTLLRNRDVRAALLYAIDRDQLAQNLRRSTVEPVSIPGITGQSPSWGTDGLRKALRSYRYDLERATTLLTNAGFRRTDGEWQTPAGDTFDLELLTSGSSTSMEHTIADQWSSFGIDATARSIEGTSYQTRLQDGTFYTAVDEWSVGSASGQRHNRAGEYVESLLQGNDHRYSGYLVDEVASEVEANPNLWWSDEASTGARTLEFEALDDLRGITVEAPPLGEPTGSLQEWPYLYHAIRLRSERELDAVAEHAKICTWVYNYQVPVLELLFEKPMIVHDTVDWEVPRPSDPIWRFANEKNHSGGLWAALVWGEVTSA